MEARRLSGSEAQRLRGLKPSGQPPARFLKIVQELRKESRVFEACELEGDLEAERLRDPEA